MAKYRPNPIWKCTQCGGQLHPDEGQRFLSCPYCDSSVYLDPSKVVFHWVIKANIDKPSALSLLTSWMAGKDTAKELEKEAQITDKSFEYFPLWYFKTRKDGKDQIFLQPARATGTTELTQISLPGGDFEPFSLEITDEAGIPTVPLEAATEWVRSETPRLQFLEIALVHIPIYIFKYEFKNHLYTALIEGSTGRILANIFPKRKRIPYILMGLLVASIFTCLSFVPLLSYLIWQWDGVLYGSLACTGVGIIMIPILIGLAALVAART